MPDNYSWCWIYHGKQTDYFLLCGAYIPVEVGGECLKYILNVSNDDMCSEETMEDKDPDLWPIETEWLRTSSLKWWYLSRDLEKNF